MTTIAERPGAPLGTTRELLARAPGLELLGPIDGSGYKEGAFLVRRPDGQIVQLGPLMYALLDCADGQRSLGELARAMSEQLGRRIEDAQVARLGEKAAAQGLLEGSEHRAPPRRNPLLALRWKVLVTKPAATRWLTAPFAWLFRPWVMWPVLAAFVAVCWFVLIDKGVASATAQAFHRPALLLLIFGLAIASAAFHEVGHAAACRYGGATPGGMGMGLYLVWPAFYTDVTDAYRLDRRSRLRVDLGGLYFNAVVAVVTMAFWLILRTDALLLLIALQLLQMVKQLSPVIRADGYHILSDATGVPDLFAHLGPTLRRLLPGRRAEPSALTGRARFLVTAWVAVIVPVLLSLMLGAVLALPRLLTTAWDSGRHLASQASTQAAHGDLVGLLASALQMLALLLPVGGSILIVQKFGRTMVTKARRWSEGRPGRRMSVLVGGTALVCLLTWAWWPAGQYQPVQASDRGTLGSLFHTLGSPASVARPSATPASAASPMVAPGRYVALAMVPANGITPTHPALFVLPGSRGGGPVAVLSGRTDRPGGVMSRSTTFPAGAFPFVLPGPPGPGGTQAEAVNTTNGGVVYVVAYALITVQGGQPVTNANSAYALASCRNCTTVAVSFQLILIIGHSQLIAPIDAAVALNDNCPACVTTAIADQLVLSLNARPSPALLQSLEAALQQLNSLPALGPNASPAAVASEVAGVQDQIQQELTASGLVTTPSSPATANNAPTGTGSSSTGSTVTPTSTPSGSTGSGTSSTGSGSSNTSSSDTSVPSSSNSSATTTAPTSTTTTTTTTTSGPTTTVP